jgi:uncharacterized membrane protein
MREAVERNRSTLILLIILAVGAALRVYAIGVENYWFDELQSMESSAGRGWVDQSLPRDTVLEKPQRPGSLASAASWWKIPPAMTQQEVMPPLYFIILRFWRDVFGSSEIATRALSALASFGGILLIYLIARDIYGKTPALWAAGLLAVNPTQIEFAHEARTYAVTAIILLVAFLSLIRLRGNRRTMDAVLLGGCLLAAMLTHYFAAGAALAIGISAIFLRSGSARRNALIAIGGAGLLYLILWGPAMLAQRTSFHRNLGAVLDITGQTSLTGRIGVAIVSQISKHSPESMALTIAVVLALIVACFLQPRRRESLVAILWLICTVVLFIVIDTRGGSSTLTVARYGTLFAPAIFLIVGGAATGANWRWRSAIPALFMAASVFHLHDAYLPWKGEWRAAARVIVQRPEASDIVVIASKQSRSWWLGRSFLGICWYGAERDDRFPLDVVMLSHPPGGDVLARLRAAGSFWIITDSTQEGPEFAVPGVKVESQVFVKDVFMLFRVRWSEPPK